MVADIEELESLDAAEIHARRLNAKEVIMPKSGEHFTFPVADGTVKLSGREKVFRRSTSIRDHPARGEEHNDVLQAECDGSHPLDTLTDDGVVRTDFWTVAEFLQCIIVSVNQFSIYGTIKDWCQELAQRVDVHSPQSTDPSEDDEQETTQASRDRLQGLMANARTFDEAMYTSLPGSPVAALSSNFGSPDGSDPDLERMGGRSRTLDDKVNEKLSQLTPLPLITRSVSGLESCVQTVSQSMATITTKVTSIEQLAGGLAARVAALEAGALSASSVSGSPIGSWPLPGQLDGSTGTGSRDRGSLDENRKTRRKLDTDTCPDDENARSAVLSRFPCEQCHSCLCAWLNKKLDRTDPPERVHCKRGTKSARIVFKTSAKCQDFLERFNKDGLRYTVNRPFCNATSTNLLRQSKSPEWGEI